MADADVAVAPAAPDGSQPHEQPEEQHEPVALKKTLLVINAFVVRTTQFLNHFATLADERLDGIERNMGRLEKVRVLCTALPSFGGRIVCVRACALVVLMGGGPHIPSFPPSLQAIDNLESRFARIPELAHVKASNPPAQAQAQASTEPATQATTQAGSWGLPRPQCLGSRVPPSPPTHVYLTMLRLLHPSRRHTAWRFSWSRRRRGSWCRSQR